MHALGHIAANVSFAAVAISLSHTVKTLEPAFNCALTYFITGQGTPLPVILTLIPIIVSLSQNPVSEFPSREVSPWPRPQNCLLIGLDS